jgi:hypothetical protein
MQGAALVGVFLRVAPFVAAHGLSVDDLMAAVKPALAKSVGKRGGAVVDANLGLIRAAYEDLIDVTGPLRGVAPAHAEPRKLQEAMA